MGVMIMKNRMLLFILLMSLGVFGTGCAEAEGKDDGVIGNDITYSIVEDEDIPEEMASIIEKEMTEGNAQVILFENSQYVFIGLGERNTGGYGIHIDHVKDVEGSISILYNETKPNKESMTLQVITYPYVVLRIHSVQPIEITEGEPIIQNDSE